MNFFIKKSSRGFGFVELMVALIITMIVMIFVYKYMIKGVKNMAKTSSISFIEANARRAFNSVVQDLKFLGFNPKSMTDPDTNLSIFGIRTTDFSGNSVHLDPYDSIVYSYYNPDFFIPPVTPYTPSDTVDPDYPSGTPDGSRDCFSTEIACTQTKIWVDTDGTLKKQYIDSRTDSLITLDLVSNACARFLFCDKDLLDNSDPNISGNYCNPDKDANSTNQAMDPPPEKLIFVLAVLPNNRFMGDFDGACVNTSLQPNQYVRFEKIIHLTNLR